MNNYTYFQCENCKNGYEDKTKKLPSDRWHCKITNGNKIRLGACAFLHCCIDYESISSLKERKVVK